MTTDISVGVRWDPINQQNETINQDDYEFEYDGGNSSSRLFERSRIKALAGKHKIHVPIFVTDLLYGGGENFSCFAPFILIQHIYF
jgi:spectrin beta